LNFLFELQIKSAVRDFGFGLSEVRSGFAIDFTHHCRHKQCHFDLRSRKLNMLRQQGFAVIGRRLSNVAWTIDVGAQ
jgi:hypothetical protein